ncbi:MAG TPA: MBL fold metallo-hydrolase [Bacillus sp. (in: firmicutes)]|uniref:MBL fold metallo-hydrolase n=1 Tax=Bacillus litorisediminis TaxID=2922713 RepID=UPI001FAE6D05|nr:MBL fold metallo-hydrolase [Bacillus litorisediminis]HWO77537.1 MBL fold metallo-hydrolase [Bacillus sp. (in: firmicutes)]
MEFIRMTNHCGYYQAAVNIGYIHVEDRGFLIDAGLEAAAAKKVVKHLQAHGLPLTHLMITHAHSDHFGGARYLKENFQVKVIAPELEAAIVENPVLEPIYLFQGTFPVQELRNKFIEAPPVTVDKKIMAGQEELDGVIFKIHSLPGHSYQQIGIEYDGILFAADSYFGAEALHKHKIPFIVNYKLTMESLEKLSLLHVKGAVPGHGHYEEEFQKTVRANINCHQQIVNLAEEFIRQQGTCTFEEMFAYLCRERNVKISHLSSFLLFRTTVGAYIAHLSESKKAIFEIKDYQWIIQSI